MFSTPVRSESSKHSLAHFLSDDIETNELQYVQYGVAKSFVLIWCKCVPSTKRLPLRSSCSK
jgi:hypothetical protein